MQTIDVDVIIVGAGGGGLRAAIAAAEANPTLKIALLSKVYPMRSHTVAAEGGAAAVTIPTDSLDSHFNDTVAGGDWLCEQDVVDYFVQHSFNELVQLEQWGCPWSRKPDGTINVRRFGGMKTERTWFAADKTGFHMLHTLFQTSIKYPQIIRYDEFYVLDILVDNDQVHGVVALDMMEGTLVQLRAGAVVFATGGSAQTYRYNTNANIVTGDGMAIAYRHGVPLRDMEFIQYHPTGLPGTGILMTEGCRGEGGILVNKDGYRYLQDYGLGPETPLGKPENKYMELGPRDKVSQAFWHEWQKGRTIKSVHGDVVHLDLRHLGEQYINERLPLIRELSQAYMGIDPVHAPIPVRPTAHYTMGGIETKLNGQTRINGLYAVGECASVGLHGANRLGSNSLAELLVFGRLTGEAAAQQAVSFVRPEGMDQLLNAQAQDVEKGIQALLSQQGDESQAKIREQMGMTMEEGCGLYRSATLTQATVDQLADLQQRVNKVGIKDKTSVFNTELISLIELKNCLLLAQCIAYSALNRKESRGAHQRLDEGCTQRDDQNFLRHTLAFYRPEGALPELQYTPVTITRSQPAKRVYGKEAEQQEGKAENAEKSNN